MRGEQAAKRALAKFARAAGEFVEEFGDFLYVFGVEEADADVLVGAGGAGVGGVEVDRPGVRAVARHQRAVKEVYVVEGVDEARFIIRTGWRTLRYRFEAIAGLAKRCKEPIIRLMGLCRRGDEPEYARLRSEENDIDE